MSSNLLDLLTSSHGNKFQVSLYYIDFNCASCSLVMLRSWCNLVRRGALEFSIRHAICGLQGTGNVDSTGKKKIQNCLQWPYGQSGTNATKSDYNNPAGLSISHLRFPRIDLKNFRQCNYHQSPHRFSFGFVGVPHPLVLLKLISMGQYFPRKTNPALVLSFGKGKASCWRLNPGSLIKLIVRVLLKL